MARPGEAWQGKEFFHAPLITLLSFGENLAGLGMAGQGTAGRGKEPFGVIFTFSFKF